MESIFGRQNAILFQLVKARAQNGPKDAFDKSQSEKALRFVIIEPFQWVLLLPEEAIFASEPGTRARWRVICRHLQAVAVNLLYDGSIGRPPN
jgi:hypothetical protein